MMSCFWHQGQWHWIKHFKYWQIWLPNVHTYNSKDQCDTNHFAMVFSTTIQVRTGIEHYGMYLFIYSQTQVNYVDKGCHTLIARFMGPTWGPPGAARTQVGPMLATRTFYRVSTIGVTLISLTVTLKTSGNFLWDAPGSNYQPHIIHQDDGSARCLIPFEWRCCWIIN